MDITENMKRQYKLILDFSSPEEEKRWEIMTDEVMGGISQSQMFITSNKTAIFRGRAVPEAPKLEVGHIRRISVMIADKQAGPFTLEIDWVKSYAENNS